MSFVAKPKNFGNKIARDPQTLNLQTINKTENVDQLIADNKQIDIPFLYNLQANFQNAEETIASYENKTLELLPIEEVTRDFFNQTTLVVHRYYTNLKNHIDQGHFTVAQVRAYLLVKSYIQHHLSINHSFQTIGKTYTQVIAKQNQDVILEFHKQNNAVNNGNLFETNNQIEASLRVVQVQMMKEKLVVDFQDLYTDNKDPHNLSRYFYYRTESIRILNLVIDEIIAGTRNINKKYHSNFFYKTVAQELKEFKGEVLSSVNEINIKDLQTQANLSDAVMRDAALVAIVLAKDNETYAVSANHLANPRTEYETNFTYPCYRYFSNPKNGDENNLALEHFQVARLYVEHKLEVKSE